MTDNIAIGKFDLDEPLILTRAQNGGWVITQSDDPRCVPISIGAYSNAKDMIRALESALCSAVEP